MGECFAMTSSGHDGGVPGFILHQESRDEHEGIRSGVEPSPCLFEEGVILLWGRRLRAAVSAPACRLPRVLVTRRFAPFGPAHWSTSAARSRRPTNRLS